jgi:hypothetical protein
METSKERKRKEMQNQMLEKIEAIASDLWVRLQFSIKISKIPVVFVSYTTLLGFYILWDST